MNKIDLGYTIQIVANLGVVADILLLTLEIRQNTESVDLQRQMALWSLRLETQGLMLDNSDIRAAMLKFNAQQEELTPEERLLVEGTVGRRFEVGAWIYRNFPELLDQDDVRCAQSMPARIREIWEARKNSLDPEYVRLRESCDSD